MRIELIEVGGFGLFNRGIKVEFGDAPIAIVLGDNESGKSTMMEAIVATIFGFADGEREQARRPWDEHESYSCSVTFRLSDSSLLQVTRNFSNNHVNVRRLNGGEAGMTLFSGKASPRSRWSANAERYYSLLEKIFHFRDADVFTSSVFVRQQQMETEFSDRMRRIVSGSLSTDYARAQAALEDEFFQLTKHDPWRGRDGLYDGEIDLLEARKKDICRVRYMQREAERKRETTAQQQKQVKEEIDQLRDELEENVIALESVIRFNHLTEQRGHLLKQESALKRELDNLRNISERAKRISKQLSEKYADFDGLGVAFQEKLVQAAEFDDAHERRNQRLELEEQHWRIARQRERRIAALIMGVTLALTGVVVGFLLAAEEGSAIGGLGGLLLGYLLSCLIPSLPGGNAAAAQARVSALREEVEDLANRRQQCVDEIESVCGSRDVSAVSAQFDEYCALHNKLAAAKSVQDTFRTEEEIRGELDETVQKLAATEAQIEQVLETTTLLREVKDDPQKVAALETELRQSYEEKKKNIEERREREGQLRLEMGWLSASEVHDDILLEEELEEIEQELAKLRLRADALKCAIDALSGAILEYREGYLPRLEDEITELFSKIVGGRYIRIRFSESLKPLADAAEQSDIEPAALSVGTRDQLYLAMRLAFAGQISRGETLPLILDDPFANFDARRLEAVYRILTSVSEKQQIILFTHDHRLSEWGDVVVDLNKVHAGNQPRSTSRKKDQQIPLWNLQHPSVMMKPNMGEEQ